MITTLFITLLALVIYNHLFYPFLLSKLKKGQKKNLKKISSDNINTVAVVVTAYNEEKYIDKKIKAFQQLTYTNKHLFVYDDGSTDKTESLLVKYRKIKNITIILKEKNKGKIDSLNHYINNYSNSFDYTLFTDASSTFNEDVIERLQTEFNRKNNVSVVSSAYFPHKNSKDIKYWNFQRLLKDKESFFGNVIGVHGSGYMVKNKYLSQLPINTINDDLVLPSRTISKGGKVIYSDVPTYELENDNKNDLNYTRRVRIGAGNLQQIFLCSSLLNIFKRPMTFINFFSMKVLRTLMPFIFATMALITPFIESKAVSQLATVGLICFLFYVILLSSIKGLQQNRIIGAPYYIIKSYYYSGIGSCYFLIAKRIKGWYEPIFSKRVSFIKRTFDIASALILLTLSLPVLLIAMVALKLENSSAPILFKQNRVGLIKDNEEDSIFKVIKLRTMIMDAEKETGAVFATKGDPRVTTVGRILRKSRIDEIPQFINVLKGEMSLVGPRPERPEIMLSLKKEMPDFYKRTVGVKPGITGLAQVKIGYNEALGDISEKYKMDQKYKQLSNESIFNGVYNDVKIMWTTIAIVLTMKGI